MAKNNKYPNGFLPKIAFHMFHGDEAKVRYFTDRQVSTYGELTTENMVYITSELQAYMDVSE